MAVAFIDSSSNTSTRIPAAALAWKSSCGRDTQLKIWIGSTVNGDQIESGANVANVTAPAMMSGAVSPIARDSARINPVKIPGVATGSTWCQIVCHFVAPSAYEPSRSDPGTARSASRVERMTTGSTSSASVDAPARTLRPMPIIRTNRPSPEQAVDDRRHRGEVGDVQLDDARTPDCVRRIPRGRSPRRRPPAPPAAR